MSHLIVSLNRQKSRQTTEEKTTHRAQFVNSIAFKFNEYYKKKLEDDKIIQAKIFSGEALKEPVLYRYFTNGLDEIKTSDFTYFLLNYNGKEGYNPDTRTNRPLAIWGIIRAYSDSNCNDKEECDFYFINFLAHMIKYHSDIVDTVITNKLQQFKSLTDLFEIVQQITDDGKRNEITTLLKGYFEPTQLKYMKYKTKYLTLKNKMLDIV